MATPVSKYFTDPENSTCVSIKLHADVPIQEMFDWLRDCRGLYKSKWCDNNVLNVYFGNKKDAVDFKMIWG